VALYARISPTPDGKAGENFSIASQLHEMREKATLEFGCAKPREYVDNKISGGSLDRPELDLLRDHVALKMYDVIIAYSPDRWTREPSDKIILKRELEKGGARLVYVVVTYEDTAEGELAEGVQDVVSKYEKRKFKERARRCRRQKSRDGLPHSCHAPDGYRFEGHEFGKKGEYVIVPERAKVVKTIFEQTAKGMSSSKVALWLNEQDILTQKGNRWYRTSITQVLEKTAYYGEMTQNGDPIRVPVIVERKLWDRAHAALHRNVTGKGRPPRHYLLSGLLFCKLCGKRCATWPRRGDDAAYRCNNIDHVNRGTRLCFASEIRKSILEPAVWNAVWDTVCDPGLLWEMIEAYYDRVAAKQGKAKDPAMAKIDRARRAVQHAERIFTDPEQRIPFEQAAANLDKARKDLAAAEALGGPAEVIVMPERKNVAAASTELRKMRNELESFESRRKALEILVDKVLYADRQAEIHCRIAAPTARKCNRRISDDCILSGSIPFVITRRIA
jgi:site-specific DNA recombinase